jgi:hypothetical protein
MCEMRINILDFRIVLNDKHRPPDQSYSTVRNPHKGAIVKPHREGPTIPVQLRGGLQSHNRIVTPVGTTIICMAGAPRP